LRKDWDGVRDEFVSTAFLALVEAAQTFDAARQVNFATYARHHISGALRDLRRDLCTRGCWSKHAYCEIPKVVRLGRDFEEHHRVIGDEPDEPVEIDLETRDLIEGLIRQLPRKHAAAFRHIYLNGKSQEEAARLVGCSASYMSRLHREAINWLSEVHGKEQLA
jgi:RNA polymerase sigma factor (sigma-70 family)